MRDRFFVAFALALLFAAMPATVFSQTAYPANPVRIIVPFSPGGASDILARVVAKGLSERWKQSVFVENKPGGSAIIGTELAANSAPDGYTILFGTISNLGVNPTLYEGRLPYDPLKSFAPITLAASVPMMLVVHESVPAKSVGELVSYMKGRSDMNFGSGGNGTSQHLAMEMFKQRAGVPATHIPYKSSAPAMNDLLGGQIQMMFDNLNTALPHVASGRIRPLAVTSPERSPLAPNVPTMAEQGFPGYQMGTWFAFMAPANTPPAILNEMNASVVSVLREPGTENQLSAQGMDIISSSAADLTAYLGEEIAKWRTVVKTAGIRVD